LEFSAEIFLAGKEWKTMKGSAFPDARKAFILKQA
jgi:hypothetical protein